jgi:genome maintenance exonuclease 1
MLKNTNRRVFDHCPASLGYDSLGDASTADRRIYVTPDGKKYPSITTVLGARGKDGLTEWRNAVGEDEANRVCHHAATRGTAMHNIAERYINNEEVYFEKNTMPHVKSLFNAIRPILDEHVGNVILQECPLYSDHLGVAGRVDLVAYFDGKLSIVDFKTSKRVKEREDIKNYFAQATAYAIMFEERTGIPVPQLVIIMAIDDNPNPKVFIEKRNDWVGELREAISEYNQHNYTCNE